jgi:GNAT superfamily N-acetyltransferase
MTNALLRPLPDIRYLHPQEATAATEVISAAFRRYLALIGLTVEGTTNPYDYLPEAITDRRAWGAWIDQTLVGVALVDAISDTHWQIDLVGVLEDHAKGGIGRAIMQCIEAEARDRHITLLSLNTLEIATWLWTFYQGLGFHITDRAPPKHGLDDNIRVFMEKPLH